MARQRQDRGAGCGGVHHSHINEYVRAVHDTADTRAKNLYNIYRVLCAGIGHCSAGDFKVRLNHLVDSLCFSCGRYKITCHL